MQSNIYNLRAQKGFSLRKLSKICGVSYSYLSRLENNKICEPSIAKCHRVARALGVSLDELFFFDEEGKKEMIVRLLGYKNNKLPLTELDFSRFYAKLTYHERLCLSEILLEYLEIEDSQNTGKSKKQI